MRLTETAQEEDEGYVVADVDDFDRVAGTISRLYRVVQLNFTPGIEVFYMLFDRCHTRNKMRSSK